MNLKSPEEIKILREGGRILSQILKDVAAAVKPGISTLELDELARSKTKKAGVRPAFLGYKMGKDYPEFPAALCTSIDNEIVHGIPSQDRVLEEGQIVGLDLGVEYHGLFTDAAVTVPVGRISSEKEKLLQATRAALFAGINVMRSGNTIGDIGFEIQRVAKGAGLSVIRDLVGHGVGHAIHEPPNVPNYGRRGSLEKLVCGMVLAIEPMFTTGDYRIKFLNDNWTVVTADGSFAAHFEHTVAITEKGHIILT